LVVGDVHGCAAELAQLLEDAQANRVVLVGDLFTKGPDPVGVWRLIQDQGLSAVLGNHDVRLLELGEGSDDERTHRTRVLLDEDGSGWREWLSARPLHMEVAGYTVVHAGVHPSGDLEQTRRSDFLTLRRWPDEESSDPRWHDVYTGARKVIFGHDARGGLVRVLQGGVPWLIGLDTGCVYGKQLTGWVPEEDTYVTVQAARCYCPVR